MSQEPEARPEPGPRPPITHEQFMRMFLQAERELLRYVMALVPDLNDARDVIQDTAAALWQAVDKYDPARPFTPWACRFALNKARAFLRTEGRRRLLEEDVAGLVEARRWDAAEQLDARREALRDCLRRLPPDQYHLVYAHYFNDEPVEALAARLARGREAVYKAIQRIRLALHACVDRRLKIQGG